MIEDLSDFLKRNRIAKSMTQSEVAKSLGISRVTYCQYENGYYDTKNGKLYRRVPSPRVARKIAKLFGCDIKYVVEMIEIAKER